MAGPDVGDRAPDFELPNQDGDLVRLDDLEGQPTVLFFYPGDFTPICTREACSFRDNFEAFRELDATVLGISTDPPDEHARFREEYDLEFDLLSDEDGDVCQAYGADGLLGTKRVTFVLDGRGIVRERFRSPFPGSHVDEALEAIRGQARA